MIAVVALVLVIAVTVRRHRRVATLDAPGDAQAWPCVVARAAACTRLQAPDAVSGVLDALAQGPRRTRRAVHVATQRVHGVAASPPDRLAAACHRLADTRGDRLHATAVVAGTPAALTALWRREVDDVAHHDDWAIVTRVARSGRWLLLAPLAPVALGAVTDAVGVVLTVVAALSWAATGPWIDAAGPRRVSRCAPTAHLGAPPAPSRA